MITASPPRIHAIGRRATMAGLAGACLGPAPASAQAVTVFAAASLTDAIRDAAEAWRRSGRPAFRTSFASSATLARQIEQGAAANLFLSADESWMAYLRSRNLLVPGSERSFLGNDLVLIVPAPARRTVAIVPGFDVLATLGPGGRLAIGDPTHVPAGMYAEQALRRLGVWEAVSARLARTADVRAALLFVERGEAPAGIVYASDALVSNGVAVAGTFPADSHVPITYPFALTRAGHTPEAEALLDFLSGPVAREIFVRRGFKVE